jgi:hypothetical protein
MQTPILLPRQLSKGLQLCKHTYKSPAWVYRYCAGQCEQEKVTGGEVLVN